MIEYTKIQTIFKRDMSVKGAPIIPGAYTMPEFEYLKDNVWVFTEKVDGTNVRVAWDGEQRVFGGRTDNAQKSTFLLSHLQQLFPDREAFVQHFPLVLGSQTDVILFGEGYGAKIQKGGGNYIPNGVGFILFDVLVGDWWLRREDVEDVAAHFGLRTVPIVGDGTLADATKMVQDGFLSAWGNFPAEGLVLRPKVELRTRAGHRLITKLKTRDFLRT